MKTSKPKAARADQPPKGATPEQPEPDEGPETGGQGAAARSIARDEAMKRLIKQHPQRDIPRVESVEPSKAPPKE